MSSTSENSSTNHFNKVVTFFTNHIGNKNIQIINDHKYYIIGAILLTILFILISRWCYTKYVAPIINRDFLPNKEMGGGGDVQEGNDIDIYYFYTTWCPYCKKAKPEWDRFKNNITENQIYNRKYNINFFEVDADKQIDLAKQYKVEAYPTIKLIKNNKTNNYDAKPDSNHLMEFFRGSL